MIAIRGRGKVTFGDYLVFFAGQGDGVGC
jgi:hypothetical protein